MEPRRLFRDDDDDGDDEEEGRKEMATQTFYSTPSSYRLDGDSLYSTPHRNTPRGNTPSSLRTMSPLFERPTPHFPVVSVAYKARTIRTFTPLRVSPSLMTLSDLYRRRGLQRTRRDRLT